MGLWGYGVKGVGAGCAAFRGWGRGNSRLRLARGPLLYNLPLADSQLRAGLTLDLGSPTCLTSVGDTWSPCGWARLGSSVYRIHAEDYTCSFSGPGRTRQGMRTRES